MNVSAKPTYLNCPHCGHHNCQFSIVNCQFTKGENGPHTPELMERWTQPPKPYTEGTLVRAMETAGKLVEDEELREAMKENGIGRPATRAEIIKSRHLRTRLREGPRSHILRNEAF